MIRRLALLGLISLLALTNCTPIAARNSAPASSSSISTEQADNVSFNYRFKTIKCADTNLPLEMDCGTLVVPLDHTEPGRGKARLAVTIVRADPQTKAPDPVVFLTSGPGLREAERLQYWIDHPLVRSRDLILVDLRGTGHSEPSLHCREMESGKYEDDITAAQACLERLEAQGVDPALFNSTQSVADLNALRQALGYETWNLIGVSYGTRLAQMLMRDYPQTVRSAILDSAYPLEVNAYETRAVNAAESLRNLFAACVQNSRCAHAYPDLEIMFDEMLEQLDREPVQLMVANPLNGESQPVYLDGHTLAELVYQALYTHETLARIPFVLYEVHYGNYESIAGLMFPRSQTLNYPALSSAGMDTLAKSQGAYYSYECQEEIAFNNAAVVQTTARDSGSRFAEYLSENVGRMFDVCAVWGAGKASALESAAIQSSVPVLILSGEYDPVTPGNWARQVARNLPNSFLVAFPGAGHAVLENEPCSHQIAAEFLLNPERMPDSSCTSRLGLEFWLP